MQDDARTPSFAPLHVVRPSDQSDSSPQTAGMARAEAISARTVGAEHLWMGRTVAPAGKVSGVHHHGECETAFYGLRGRVTLFFGEGLHQRLDVGAGDFGFVPAWTIHAEGNLSAEDGEAIVARSTPEPIVVNLPDLRVPEDVLHPR